MVTTPFNLRAVDHLDGTVGVLRVFPHIDDLTDRLITFQTHYAYE